MKTTTVEQTRAPAVRENNKVRPEDRAAHDWYRFVLSYPPHLVRDYVDRFELGPRKRVLDPFCGTGTTVVECKKIGVTSVGIESTPMAAFASKVKTDWTVDPKGLMAHARKVAELTCARFARQGIEDVPLILRYNRLVDIFTGVTCYSLQNHLRTTVPDMGQVETDEIYVGVDKRGVQYVFPLQAKGGSDKLNVVQIEQDFGVCATKFPGLVCRPIGAQFMADDVIALFEFEQGDEGVVVSSEKHYKLVPPEDVTDTDLEGYRQRTGD